VRPQAPPPRPRSVVSAVPEDTHEAMSNGAPAAIAGNGKPKLPASPAGARRIGRNDPCPCGSGKKYKFCHLKTGDV